MRLNANHVVVFYVTAVFATDQRVQKRGRLNLCCKMCRNVLGQAPTSSSVCTYGTNRDYVECSSNSTGSRNGLDSTRLYCGGLNSSIVSRCSNAKAPQLQCTRTFQAGMVAVNCSWSVQSVAASTKDDDHCLRSFDSPILLSANLQHGYTASQTISCHDDQCTVSFLYPEVDDLEHCPSDKAVFTINFVGTEIKATFTYELSRSESYDVGIEMENSPVNAVEWRYHEQSLTVEVPPNLVKSIRRACLTKSKALYCQLEGVHRNDTVVVILYSPMKLSLNASDDEHSLGDEHPSGDEHSTGSGHLTATCEFDKVHELRHHHLRLRFYMDGYESGLYYLPNAPLMVSGSMDTGRPITSSQLSMTFFIVASCILSFPLCCGLVLCFIWFRKNIKSPCSLCNDCMAKRNLRRTADWVDQVQTRWNRRPTSSAADFSNSDFPPSTPRSVVTDRALTERSVCWPDDCDDDDLAPSMKRPLMRTENYTITHSGIDSSFISGLTNSQGPYHDPVSAVSSAMESYYSDECSGMELIRDHQIGRQSEDRSTLERHNEDDGLDHESVDNGLLQDPGPIIDPTAWSTSVPNDEWMRINFRRGSSSDDEVSFVTAFDGDPKSVRFVEADPGKRIVDIV